MIKIANNEGEEMKVETLKIVTASEEAQASESEEVSELGKTIVAGEKFSFSIDGKSVEMSPVESSNIGHLGRANNEMFVTFKRKDGFNLYGYSDVEDAAFAELTGAESVGRHFATMKKTLKTYMKFF